MRQHSRGAEMGIRIPPARHRFTRGERQGIDSLPYPDVRNEKMTRSGKAQRCIRRHAAASIQKQVVSTVFSRFWADVMIGCLGNKGGVCCRGQLLDVHNGGIEKIEGNTAAGGSFVVGRLGAIGAEYTRSNSGQQ